MSRTVYWSLILLVVFCPCLWVVQALAQTPSTEPVAGIRVHTPTVHALIHARVVVAAGRVLDKGTIVIRDGVLTAVGSQIPVPADARVWDLSGKTIYPGLIDSFAETALDPIATGTGATHWNQNISPQLQVADRHRSDLALNEKLRGQGITVRLLAPAGGIIKGMSCLVNTGDVPSSRAVIKREVAQHIRLTISRGRSRDQYPSSPMGAVALARQTLYDAQWYHQAWSAHRANRTLPRPEQNDALAALQDSLAGGLVVIDSAHELYFLRADRFAREFSLNAVIRGSGHEYRQLDAIRNSGRTVIVPLNFPRPPNVATAGAALNAKLEDLMHWDIAPENPGRLDKAGIRIALTGAGLADPLKFLGAVRQAVKRGLSSESALRALTTVPAELCGVSDRLGSIEVGKTANLVVTHGELFDDKAKIVETWIDGRRYEITKTPDQDIRGKWSGTIKIRADKNLSVVFELGGSPGTLTGSIRPESAMAVKTEDDADADAKSEPDQAKEEDPQKEEDPKKEEKPEKESDKQPADDKRESKLQQPVVSNGQFTCLFDAKLFSELEGKAQLTVMISIPETGHPTCLGEVTWPDATRSDFAATRTAGPPTSENVDDNKSDEAKEPDAAKRLDDAKKTNEPKKREEPKEQGEAKKPEEPKRPEDKPKKPEELKEPDEPKTARKESDPPNKPDDNRKPGEPKEQGESKKLEDPKKDPEGGTPTKAPKVERETPKDGEKSKTKEKPPQKDLPASFAVNYPMGPFGRKSKPEQPKLVLFKNATIWTSGPAGTIDNGAVLVADGKIVAVGSNLAATSDALVVDASGKHISPGIIDCHSHMATDGGVNEMGQAITAEVRIGDFIDGNDIDIYRQLAGGVTAANVLHGSANPIGGQNQVIKLRWGSLPEELKFAEAPAGIKFALGENVKQSNMPAQAALRYPQSRMGVEQIIRDEFSAARDYIKSWNDWNRSHIGMQPRRDLELDAVAEVLEKKRWIHCHSYRQDEILAFLRVTDGFGVQIGTLQHILEGYKVADEMKKREVMASSFSDWWAYKFEVIDAIPYNGALLHHAGVVVSFNSDDRELARHLNHEAAKAVKYGGVPAVEALKFVTLNPARQLRVDQFVGSLESGKHADLVIWSGPPLSAMSRCEQTWIDGRRYFSLDEDRQLREDAKRMKATIVQKILATGDAMRSPEDNDGQQQDLWPREDEVCHPHFAF